MNISTKCNCCLKEDVCGNSAKYKQAVQMILETNVDKSDNGYLMLRDAKFIEVNIKCPTFLPHSATPRGDMK